MSNNYWRYNRTKKHEIWDLLIKDENTGEILVQAIETVNTHRSKGDGISDDALRSIAKKMRLSKHELIKMIRENENYDYKKYFGRDENE